ncbi:hypothetical protein I7I51_00525 [Histoplasma capsulatum]|uniref:Period circadian protein n=1 Tax=Ajellomyces capsulatus TaxID=5037 RepID=A0A8A1MH59_AJECA|nr:predicted protein [Histoplasma mississippiense (nom. inval.)]EDN08868.1 predicted protein [Histoplasma mississippiense (nom. inval.)]QSS63467.1 hypothetical protein I7I51_00525 [Histoplasma capsulatum]
MIVVGVTHYRCNNGVEESSLFVVTTIMSNIVQKAKDAVTGHSHHGDTQTTSGVGQGNHGTQGTTQGTTHHTGGGTTSSIQPPHSSNVAKKLDPRVAEDQYNPRMSTSTGSTGSALGTGAVGGATGGTTGHKSSGGTGLMHTDPVSGGIGGTGQALGSGTGHHATGQSSSNATKSSVGSGTADRAAVPHSSNVENKLDPRVDSDLYNSRTVGGNVTRK